MFLVWVSPVCSQYWKQYSECILTTVEQRGRVTSLELLAVTFLIQPRRLLAFLATRVHCWLTVKFIRTPISFLAELLSSWPVSKLWWCLGLFLTRCKTWHFPLLGFMRFLSVPFSSLSPSEWQHWCIGQSASFVLSGNLLGGTVPSSRSLMKMLNSASPSIDP